VVTVTPLGMLIVVKLWTPGDSTVLLVGLNTPSLPLLGNAVSEGAGVTASVGHATLLPSHDSATSHTLTAARHTVPAGVRASPGHDALDPVQASDGSHTPADARHTVPAAVRVSLGQLLLLPVHASCGSHTPADARHTVPDGAYVVSGGHGPEDPVQVS
jgi:hypothetical protein